MVVATSLQTHQLNLVGSQLISTLLYFDIFTYPLTFDELYNFSKSESIKKDELKSELNQLVALGYVNVKAEFYYVGDERGMIERRMKGNDYALKKMKVAKRMSKFISRFPYVRAVFLSGSISKGYMDETSDIDYFIVTKSGRLWIARFCLVLFKKTFLLNSFKHFCVNYFIDTDNLRITDHNLFTATEFVTLQPTVNIDLYNAFCQTNKDWVNGFFPNHTQRDTSKVVPACNGIRKKISEAILNNSLGDWLDKKAMNIMLKYWGKKFSTYDKQQYDVAFRSRKGVSKHHPNNFQKKVLDRLNESIATFEATNNVKLQHG